METVPLVLAWELSYLRPLQARELGRQAAAQGGPLAAEGWLHVALAELRVGDRELGEQALGQARQLYTEAQDLRGLHWCEQLQAIAIRRAGDYAGSARLQSRLDLQLAASPALQSEAMLMFVGHNSRAITCKLLGQEEDALRHFYCACDAATRIGWAGPRITALSNLGGYHQDLFNLEDAKRISEQALEAGLEAGATQATVASAVNLIVICNALGEPQRGRALLNVIEGQAAHLPPQALDRYASFMALSHLGVGEVDAALKHLQAGAVAAPADGDGQTVWAWVMARCLLAKHDCAGARQVAENALQQRKRQGLADAPYESMELLRVLADACEACGDHAAALTHLRAAQSRYETLVGRSARARYIALEIHHALVEAQRERDVAVDSRRTAEDDRQRLAELNLALQAQVGETQMLHSQLREQALRDPLTGLHNRRYLFEMAPGLLELARRQNKTLCVVLIDLDHFKLLNDTYGHHAGDAVLQRFSTLLTQMLRRSDVVCRHGGEEFVALMPDIDADGAQAMLSRLLESFQQPLPDTGKRRMPSGSFSAGIARFPRHGSTLEQLLLRADKALYAAKNQGRARIEQAPRTGFGTLF